jgi:polyphosphate kinase
MIFCNGGEEKYFITSGDLMTRNLERRVEVGVPIFDKDIQKELRDIFDLQWNDNVKARMLDKNLDNRISSGGAEKEFRSQYKIYEYLKSKSDAKEGVN